jgi:Viral BACON domain
LEAVLNYLAVSFLLLVGTLIVLPDGVASTQAASVISSGGNSSSMGYENLSVIGQPIVGLSTGSGGSNHAGFIPVLGGNGILWPIIGFDPATFSFTFSYGASSPASQGLTLANRGGSSLEWVVARTHAWLNLTPLSGTGTGSVTVSILTAGLTPGIYTDTITIGAVGAENDGITIPVTLTVSEDHILTVTFASATVPAGGGGVLFNPPPLSGSANCSGTPCQRSFHSGTFVTLSAYGDGNSLFDSWSGSCSGGSCAVTVDNDLNVVATFNYSKPAMIEGTAQYFDSLQAACNGAQNGQTVRARQFTFAESLTLDQTKRVIIKGGYSPNYQDRPGYTLLRGKLTAEKGSLLTDRLTVQ